MKLSEIAQVIRSKNAGPRRLTLDIMFASDADYQRVAQSPALGAEAIGRLYRVPADQVTIIPYPVGQAVKIVLARSIMAGDPGDYDVYGATARAVAGDRDVMLQSRYGLASLGPHGRPCAGHPRISPLRLGKTWMAGTGPAKTEVCAGFVGFRS
jgi:Domain of unknown function (DUF4387)